jgi:hypothetical protein
MILLSCARSAGAYCRTTTCPLPPSFSPSEEMCAPTDFASYCAMLATPVTPLPLWWRNACVSYDLQQDVAAQFPTASALAAKCFAKWTTTTCGAAGKVSIDVSDLGPVACDEVHYNSDQGNQHVIIFHTDVWPYSDSNNTLGLTTVTFDPYTGEIYDADMEINATVSLAVSDPVPATGYDLESILTHEAGHFLGLAHSADIDATMYAQYEPGSVTKRTLTNDDLGGICSIYLPDATRAIETIDGGVAVPSVIAAGPCDPTPRHGFQSACTSAQGRGCSMAAARPSSFWGWGSSLLAFGAPLLRRRSERKRRGRRGRE